MPKPPISFNRAYVSHFHKPENHDWDDDPRHAGESTLMVSDLMNKEQAIDIADAMKASEIFVGNKKYIFETPSSTYPDCSRVAVNISKLDAMSSLVLIMNRVLDPAHIDGWVISDEGQLNYRYSPLLATREDSQYIEPKKLVELILQELRDTFNSMGVNTDKAETILTSLKIEYSKKYIALSYDSKHLTDLLPGIEKLWSQLKHVQKPAVTQEAPRGVSTFFGGKKEKTEEEEPHAPSKGPGHK